MTRGVPNQEFADARTWARGKGPYYCDKCSFKTLYKQVLRTHVAREHSI